MDRLTYRDDKGRAKLTKYGMRMYCSTQATADCFSHLEEIVERTMPKWISVKENLPEDRKNCLLWYEYYHYSFEKVLPEYGIGFYVEKYGMWYGDPSTGKDVKVLYWMPLPEPPKEEK